MTAVLLANVVTDTTDWLNEFSANWWFLLIIFGVAFFDSVIPIVPSESMVIIGGVAAGQGDQRLVLVIAAGAVGAFLGDNFAYLIGDKMSDRIQRRADRKPKSQARLVWAAEQIRLRGGPLLITARFIPGGRTALTLSCGITNQPRGWFVKWIAIATVIWASYAALLGYVGGKTFEDNHTLAFFVAFALAMTATALIEIVRIIRSRRAEPVVQVDITD